MRCIGGKSLAVVRTQPTFVFFFFFFFFFFFAYCGTSIGYWLPFISALAPRCSYEGWAVLSGGHFRTPFVRTSLGCTIVCLYVLACEYIDMYDRERMGDILLPM